MRFILFFIAVSTTLVGQTAIATQALPPDVVELIQQDKFSEAMVRVDALLKEKPDDQELKQTKRELAGLVAPPAQAPARLRQDALTPMENAEIRMLLKDLSQAKGDDRTKYMRELMKTTAELVRKHPDQTSVWALRGMGALELEDVNSGLETGSNLLRLGADQSNDPSTLEVIVGLKRKGWLMTEAELAELRAAKLAQEKVEQERRLAWAAEQQRAEEHAAAQRKEAARKKAAYEASPEGIAARLRRELGGK